jgi:hypothetical protein
MRKDWVKEKLLAIVWAQENAVEMALGNVNLELKSAIKLRGELKGN